MRYARLDAPHTRIEITRENTSNLRHAVDTNLMAESKEKLKSFLTRVNEESLSQFKLA